MEDRVFTGGCQCGAVRYRLDRRPEGVHVCHCRMCQKAVGGPFAVICPVPKSAFVVTRGALDYFMSSDVGRRSFCRACGTPLTFDYPEDGDLGVMGGSLDEPGLVPPTVQYGNESRVAWFFELTRLAGDSTTYSDDAAMAGRIGASNHQHPDHDTDVWPPSA